MARKPINLNEGTLIDATTINKYSATINTDASQGTEINGLQTIDYTYHIRGGLRGINLDGSGNPVPNATQGDLFSYKLDYETAGFYDGNIGKQTWQSTQNNSPLGVRGYTYNYDPVSRLKSATYAGINGENYSLPNLSYDKNGNITNLQRKGKNGSSFGDVDNLSYTYNGNRLLGVTDGINGNEDVGDFRDNGNNSDYTYWNDGSLKSDANKGVSLINYDSYLKKIKQIDFGSGDWVKFYYDGNGTLLRRSNSLGEIWDYTAKGIYKNNSLYQFSQNEGRVVWNGSAFVYEFEYRDHQNNLRVAFKADGNQLIQTQVNETDPFGLEIKSLSSSGINAQNFRFQNQEKVQDFGLNLNWFKYRTQDPQTGRMWQVDALADKYVYNSVYAFSENKVTNHVELDGLEAKKSVPEWLKKGYTALASTIFKSTFSSELPKNLIEHYSYGEGKVYNLSRSEMVEVNAVKTGIQGITENDIKQFSSILENIPNGGAEQIDITVTGGALNSGTLGRFGINFQGNLSKNKLGDSWDFNGTMQYYDIWDFVTTPTRDGDMQRSNAGDIMTQLGDMYLPGTGFTITSERVPVTQTSNDKYVSFFKKLSPKPITNKIVNELETKENE